MLFRSALSQSASPSSTQSLPLSSALSPSRCLPPPHHSHSQVRSLPVGDFPHTIPTLSIALSPSRCLPPPHHSFPLSSAPSPSRHLSPPHHSHPQVRSLSPTPFHSQVRPLPVGVFLHTSRPIKCALSQSESPSSTHFHPIKCALSQSASLSTTYSLPLSSALSSSRCLSTPFPSTLKCALTQSVSLSSTPLALSRVPSTSRHLPSPLFSFHSQVRFLPVGDFFHISRPLKCALSQSVSFFPTPLTLSSALSPSRNLSPSHLSPSQVRSLPVGVFFHTTITLKCALSQSLSLSSTHSLLLSSALSPSRHLSPPHHSHPIKCALSQSASLSPIPFHP